MARTLIVGDVHGCAAELEDLLKEASLAAADHLVLVGDLVNKGPDSRDVVKLCRARGALSVLGNHDDLILRCAERRGDDHDFPQYVRKVVRALAPDELEWIASLPLYLELPALDAVVVHAGFLPGVPLAQQARENVLTMRSIRSDGTGTKRLEEGVAWASRWPGPQHVFFGHDAVRGLQRWPHATGLDTGCVYGGHLTGYLVEERAFVQVRARRAYSEPGKSVRSKLEERD